MTNRKIKKNKESKGFGNTTKKKPAIKSKQKFKNRDKRGRVLIRNLPFKATEADVRQYFSKYGKISEVNFPRRDDGQMVGCGFVQFSNRDRAAKAIADTNGSAFMGRTLEVSFAVSKPSYIAALPDKVPVPSITGQKVTTDESVPNAKTKAPGVTRPVQVLLHEDDVKQEPAESNDVRKKKEKPLQKKGRLIVRNLPFKVTEDELKNHFAQFGHVHDVKLLRRPDGRLVGCGFVQYTWKQNAAKAILRTSGKLFMGRVIIVDWAVPKNVFEAKMQEEELAEIKSEPEDNVVAVKEEVDDKEDVANVKHSEKQTRPKPHRDSSSDDADGSDEVEESEDEDENGSVLSEESIKHEPGTRQRAFSNDVAEGCTVFVKNLPFSTTSEQLEAFMQQFGDVVYALVCVDNLTEHSKGTAFVKFKGKESAEKCLSAGEELQLGDQELEVLPALPKQQILERAQSRKEAARNRDSRNLYLVKEGVVVAGSKAAAGVSGVDMARRLHLEQWKSQMLRNLNMFVSRTRLVVHNLPPSWDDARLRQLFTEHAPPGAFIKEARVMRDIRNLDLKGVGKSKEYGFVTFGAHEAALHALRSINNNPKIFTPAKRPIVAFSIENKAILNLKQRRLMKSQEKNPLARAKERVAGKKGLVDKEGPQRRQGPRRQDDVECGPGPENAPFSGVAAKPGKVKMRSRFKLRTQAAVHSEAIRQEKRNRKEQQRRVAQLRQPGRRPAAEPQNKKGKKKVKVGAKEDEVFSKMVDTYRRKLSNASAVRKWYE